MKSSDLERVLVIENCAHTHPWKPSSFETRLKKNDLCWVATSDDLVMGYAIISCAAGDAELLNISVDPKRQRKGVARALLEAMIKCVSPKAENLFLEVRVSNHKAIELYSRLDFFEVGSRRNYYPTKSGREDALIMARLLS